MKSHTHPRTNWAPRDDAKFASFRSLARQRNRPSKQAGLAESWQGSSRTVAATQGSRVSITKRRIRNVGVPNLNPAIWTPPSLVASHQRQMQCQPRVLDFVLAFCHGLWLIHVVTVLYCNGSSTQLSRICECWFRVCVCWCQLTALMPAFLQTRHPRRGGELKCRAGI